MSSRISGVCADSNVMLKEMFFELEINLVDWLKVMVASCRLSNEVVDPNIETKLFTRALERELWTALRCIDADADKRPKMCQVVCMLDTDEPIRRSLELLRLDEFTSWIAHVGSQETLSGANKVSLVGNMRSWYIVILASMN